jgi:hypothetical protein
VRLTVSSRNTKAGVVETKPRLAAEPESVARAEVVAHVRALRDQAIADCTVENIERIARGH